jgi:hypothetical protein
LIFLLFSVSWYQNVGSYMPGGSFIAGTYSFVCPTTLPTNHLSTDGLVVAIAVSQEQTTKKQERRE